MQSIGIRELKNRLSEFVRIVQAGERVLVTDRGRVVAELREPSSRGEDAVPTALAELARQGDVTLATTNKVRYPKLSRVTETTSAQQLLDIDRADL